MARAASTSLFALIVCTGAPAWANTLTVTNGNDAGSGSLRQALLDANDGDSIVFDAGVGTVTLSSGELDVTKSVTITGAASPYTRIQFDVSNTTYRVLKVGPGASAGSRVSVALQNLDLENGSQSGNAGGAIYLDEYTDLTIAHCTLNANHADSFGGAINVTATSSLTMSACTLSNNTAGNWGGAISLPYGGMATIDGSTFVANSSSEGGAIQMQSWSGSSVVFNLTNSTLTGNSDNNHYASAISVVRSGDTSSGVTVNLTNITVANNATSPSAVRTYDYVGGGGSGSLSLVSTGSVYSNPLDQNNLSGLEITGSYNLLSDGGSNSPNLTNPLLNTDPQLGALADNGGQTQTMLLAYTSPAVDAQPSAACTATTDQRGLPRPQNRACDMGAVELDRIFANDFE